MTKIISAAILCLLLVSCGPPQDEHGTSQDENRTYVDFSGLEKPWEATQLDNDSNVIARYSECYWDAIRGEFTVEAAPISMDDQSRVIELQGTAEGATFTDDYLKAMSEVENVAIGRETLHKNLTGSCNTAGGNVALHENVSGKYNTAMGNMAMFKNKVGNWNTAYGAFALFNNEENGNTALGADALFGNRWGHSNTAVGMQALTAVNDNGSRNVAIGYQAGLGNRNGSGNIFIGYKAGLKSSAQRVKSHHEIRLDSRLLIANGPEPVNELIVGNFANGSVQINQNLYSTRSFIVADRRLMTDISPVSNRRPSIFQLKGKRYRLSGQESDDIGFIAQDVEKIFPELISVDERGFKAVNYSKLIVLLITQLSAQEQKIKNLTNRIEQQEEFLRKN